MKDPFVHAVKREGCSLSSDRGYKRTIGEVTAAAITAWTALSSVRAPVLAPATAHPPRVHCIKRRDRRINDNNPLAITIGKRTLRCR